MLFHLQFIPARAGILTTNFIVETNDADPTRRRLKAPLDGVGL
jgi:hypothetical protein